MDPITGAVIGGGLTSVVGMLGQSKQHKRNKELMGLQQEQNKELMEQQKLNSKDLTKFNKAQELQMWKDTSFPAQVKMLEEAGLNVGMMYGMGGTGGSTTGAGGATAGGASAGLASAPQSSLAGDMAQGALISSQIANVDAQTEKTKAETTNIEGNTNLQSIQMEFDAIRNEIAGETKWDQMEAIRDGAKKMMHEANIAGVDQVVNEMTQREQIAKIKNEATLSLVEIGAKEQGIQLDRAKINEIVTSLEQKWESLRLEERGQEISKENMKMLTEAMLWQAGIHATGDLVNSIISVRKMGQQGRQFDQTLNEQKRQFDNRSHGSSETRTHYDKYGKTTGSTQTNKSY